MSLIFLCLELALLALLRFMGMEEIPDALAAALILVYSFAYIACLPRKPHCKKYAPALIAGYLFRIALLFFDIYGRNIYVLPNSEGDAIGFYLNAVKIARGSASTSGFVGYMGIFFRWFGISHLYGQFILTLCSIVAIECAAKCINLVELDERNSSFVMWLLNLLPNFAILSVLFLRESIVTMFISLSLYQFIKWYKDKREWNFIFAIILTFLGMRFHSGAIAVPVGYIFARMMYDKKSGKLRLKMENILAAAVILLVGVFFLNNYGSSFLGKFGAVESLDDVAKMASAGGSSYVQYVGNSNNPVNMLIYTIPRMVFFLFSPMPWMIRGISDIIAFCFSSYFYLITTIRTLRYLRKGEKENRELVIVIFIVCLCAAFVFGWGTSNSGTACRHRDKMTIVWGVLFGLTILPKQRKVQSAWLA